MPALTDSSSRCGNVVNSVSLITEKNLLQRGPYNLDGNKGGHCAVVLTEKTCCSGYQINRKPPEGVQTGIGNLRLAKYNDKMNVKAVVL